MTDSKTAEMKTYSRDKLPWLVPNEVFLDGSKIQDWRKIESYPWTAQNQGHDLSFDIYEHDGQFWKLYRARAKTADGRRGSCFYGGQACRMAEVRYTTEAVSPHSFQQKRKGEVEWVRVEEVDAAIHEILRRGIG